MIIKWSSLTLSNGGRLALAQLLINNLPFYSLSFFKSGKGVTNMSEWMVRNFFVEWGFIKGFLQPSCKLGENFPSLFIMVV